MAFYNRRGVRRSPGIPNLAETVPDLESDGDRLVRGGKDG
jgi:hypothetical protein